MTTKQVTAQNFWDVMDCTESFDFQTGLTTLEEIKKENTIKNFDALLSQARKEAVEEYKAFMRPKLSGLQDDAGNDISRHFQ